MDRKAFFNQLAQDWEKNHQPDQDKEKLKKLCQYFLVKRGEAVLDAGCGSGRLIPFLTQAAGQEGFVVELDFSEEMLKIARKKYKQKNLFFLQADAQKLPFQEGSFETVICLALFPHLPNKLAALREFRRILKPGKKLYIAHLITRQEVNSFHAGLKGPVNKDFLPDQSEMDKLFSLAGFKKLRIKDGPSFYLAQGET